LFLMGTAPFRVLSFVRQKPGLRSGGARQAMKFRPDLQLRRLLWQASGPLQNIDFVSAIHWLWGARRTLRRARAQKGGKPGWAILFFQKPCRAFTRALWGGGGRGAVGGRRLRRPICLQKKRVGHFLRFREIKKKVGPPGLPTTASTSCCIALRACRPLCGAGKRLLPHFEWAAQHILFSGPRKRNGWSDRHCWGLPAPPGGAGAKKNKGSPGREGAFFLYRDFASFDYFYLGGCTFPARSRLGPGDFFRAFLLQVPARDNRYWNGLLALACVSWGLAIRARFVECLRISYVYFASPSFPRRRGAPTRPSFGRLGA